MKREEMAKNKGMRSHKSIYDIKRETSQTAPHFFGRKTMKFFGQRMKDFKVRSLGHGKRYRVSASSGPNWREHHLTERIYNPETKELEHIPSATDKAIRRHKEKENK